MAQTIKLKRSASSGAVPSTSSLELGEVAINTYDGKMYIKKNDGSDSVVEVGGTATQQTAIWQPYAYTATSNQTTFTGSDDNSRTMKYIVGYLEVYVNGLLLDPSTDYTATNGVSIVLATAASASDLVQINTFVKVVGTGDITLDTFTGNGSTVAYTLSVSPGSENNTQVYVNAVYQNKDTYTVSGTTLTFDTAPVNNAEIEVTAGSRNVSFTDVNDLTISGDLVLADTKKLKLGDSSDLEIYHDTSNSIIRDNGAGHIQILSGTVTVGNAALSKTSALFSSGGAQTLYYDNDPKFVTSSAGIGITGNIAVSGTVDGVDIATRDGILTSTTTTAGAALPKAGGAMTGAITTNSTFDGRDVATDGTKLDGIEVGADVTDTANVTSSGALMDSEVTNLAQVKAFDSSDYATAAQGTTANAALPKAGGTMTGTLNIDATDDLRFRFLRGGTFKGGIQVPTSTGDMIANSAVDDLTIRSQTNMLFATGGNTERMRIDSSGSVGIGTDDPNTKLHIKQTNQGSFTEALRIENSGGGADEGNYIQWEVANTSGYGPRIGGRREGTGGVGLHFYTGEINATPTEAMRIDHDGNVGIGTDSPVAKLHIQGAGTYNHTPGQNTTSDFVITSSEMADNNAHSIMQLVSVRQSLSTGNGSTGYLGFSTMDDSNAQGIRDAGRIAIVNEVGSSRNSATALSFWTNAGGTDTTAAVEKMRITSAGKVGIGTIDPVGNLHIVGGDGLNGSSTIGSASNEFIIENNSDAGLTIRSGADAGGVISFADPDDHNVGQVYYSHDTDKMSIVTNDDVQMTINSAGTVEIANDLLANNAKLKAIAESNTDTAVDVFVYDTRKDSDGGAWRKRTQNTSWYNETLNTSTRGARKEFPSVAVIVAESNQVTIYDGDDPDMPMWMVFNVGRSPVTAINWYTSGVAVINSVAMLNGSLVVGTSGAVLFKFVSDDTRLIYSAQSYQLSGETTLAYRNNTGTTVFSGGNGYQIVNSINNDVAMTVLPNAPIDADTGLPVPTIALATEGGVSIIKDDGTVVDFTNSSGSAYSRSMGVSFTKNNQIRFMMDASDRFYRTYNIPEADVSVAQWSATSDQGLTVYMSSAYGDVPNIDYQTISCVEENAVGGGNGLLKFEQNDPNPAASLFSHTTSDYNTGWMVGDTKLATLSDTDTTNAVGTNLVTNGDFASNTTGWSSGNVSTLSVSGGQLVITATGAAYPSARQVISVVPNQPYYYSVDIKRGTCNVDVHLEYNDSVGSGWQQLASHNSTTLTTFTGTIVPSGGTIDLRVTIFTNSATTGHTAIADNVVVRLAENDRSVGGSGYQGKALGVFGTVTKTAVATGAELVGYSGFSTSNYLQQPYNADLQFGTGDFSIACWVKAGTANAYRRFISIQDPTGNQNNNDAINIKYAPPSSGFIYAYLGTSEGSIATAAGIPANIWQQVILLRSSGTYYLYLDGTLVSTRASTQSKGSTSHVLRVGGGADGPEPLLDGSIALVRISKTAPTPEQIKKMYNDEKHLFQENAKVTLYGTSDAVTALAYDDDTELLHVGTSAGRSEFQGLRRVNNTTDAVGAAISASNGFIVEE